MFMRILTFRAPGPGNQMGRSTGLPVAPKYLKTNSRTYGICHERPPGPEPNSRPY